MIETIPILRALAPDVASMGDRPGLEQNPLLLFTLSYSELIESLADVLFPPNIVTDSKGNQIELKASALRVDRHIHFRAAWQPDFGQRLQLALRDLTEASTLAYADRHFADLKEEQQLRLLGDLQKGLLSPVVWPSGRLQTEAFNSIHDALAAGLLADPGYGGNSNGLGWVYAQFSNLED